MTVRHHGGVFFPRVIRPAMYRLSRNDPELVHERTIRALAALGRVPAATALLARRYHVPAGTEPVTVFGVRFPGRVGLAAGMDKDGRALHAWPALGFGFTEVGTVTGLAQPGNPRPRLFHLPGSEAVINRMGFNNAGAEALAARLARHGRPVAPLGISIGKSKATPLPDALADYRGSLRALYPYADYFAINVSSPNTPGLRALQDRAALAELLAGLRESGTELAERAGRTPVPLLVKIAPDLSEHAVAELLEVCADNGVAGIIAGNTTLSRDGIAPADRPLAEQAGGLSGRPLTTRALELVRFVHRQVGDSLPVIGVGGLLGVEDARRMLDAGARLVQLYTGFALHGPELVRRINRGLAAN